MLKEASIKRGFPDPRLISYENVLSSRKKRIRDSAIRTFTEKENATIEELFSWMLTSPEKNDLIKGITELIIKSHGKDGISALVELVSYKSSYFSTRCNYKKTATSTILKVMAKACLDETVAHIRSKYGEMVPGKNQVDYEHLFQCIGSLKHEEEIKYGLQNPPLFAASTLSSLIRLHDELMQHETFLMGVILPRINELEEMARVKVRKLMKKPSDMSILDKSTWMRTWGADQPGGLLERIKKLKDILGSSEAHDKLTVSDPLNVWYDTILSYPEQLAILRQNKEPVIEGLKRYKENNVSFVLFWLEVFIPALRDPGVSNNVETDPYGYAYERACARVCSNIRRNKENVKELIGKRFDDIVLPLLREGGRDSDHIAVLRTISALLDAFPNDALSAQEDIPPEHGCADFIKNIAYIATTRSAGSGRLLVKFEKFNLGGSLASIPEYHEEILTQYLDRSFLDSIIDIGSTHILRLRSYFIRLIINVAAHVIFDKIRHNSLISCGDYFLIHGVLNCPIQRPITNEILACYLDAFINNQLSNRYPTNGVDYRELYLESILKALPEMISDDSIKKLKKIMARANNDNRKLIIGLLLRNAKKPVDIISLLEEFKTATVSERNIVLNGLMMIIRKMEDELRFEEAQEIISRIHCDPAYKENTEFSLMYSHDYLESLKNKITLLVKTIEAIQAGRKISREEAYALVFNEYKIALFALAREWETCCIQIANLIYGEVLSVQLRQTRLTNNKLPDIIVKKGVEYDANNLISTANIIIDAKKSVGAIQDDIELYHPYCSILEFWILDEFNVSKTIGESTGSIRYVQVDDLLKKIKLREQRDRYYIIAQDLKTRSIRLYNECLNNLLEKVKAKGNET